MGKDYGRRAMSRRAISGLIGVSSPNLVVRGKRKRPGIVPEPPLSVKTSQPPTGGYRCLYLNSRNVRVWINVPAPLLESRPMTVPVSESRPEADSKRGKSTGRTCIR